MSAKPTYYDCGICGALHNALEDGDCRQDEAGFHAEQLYSLHGSCCWDGIEMTEVDDWRATRKVQQ